MINEDGQDQEPHHSMYPQVMTNHIPHPPIPQLPSLQSAAGMTSSVIIHDSLLTRQQQSNNDDISEVSY